MYIMLPHLEYFTPTTLRAMAKDLRQYIEENGETFPGEPQMPMERAAGMLNEIKAHYKNLTGTKL